MSQQYYGHEQIRHVDGTPVFQTKNEKENQVAAAKYLSDVWKVDVNPFGDLAAIDWWFGQFGRVVGVGEFKGRTSHSVDDFSTVFLNLRKWQALLLTANGCNTAAVFVVGWRDDIRCISVVDIDATNLSIGGCTRRVKSDNDIEPVIEVPIVKMLSPEDYWAKNRPDLNNAPRHLQ